MEYTVTTTDPAKIKSACLVVGIFAGRRMTSAATALDQVSGGLIAAALKRRDLEGDVGQSLLLYDTSGLGAERILLIGLGVMKEYTPAVLRKAVATAVVRLQEGYGTEAAFLLDGLEPEGAGVYRTVSDLITTAEASVYRFDELKSEPKAPRRPLRKISLVLGTQGDLKTARQAAIHGRAIGSGMKLARDLGNLPGNLCTPTYLADRARQLGRSSPKLRVQVLEEAQMEKLGMDALLSVSRGSRQPAKLIVMSYTGGRSNSKPVVLVGKGLTFDAGGISIKPAEAMDEMKFDMCGGASVFGTLAACLELELPLNVIGVVPTSENLPDGNANKPGDIVTSMSGQTIEILNTDAEGRLILCDALTYSEQFKPAAVIDIATLTGACVVALGKHACGLMSNDEALAEELLEAGKASGDRAWRLPLWEDYQEQLNSNFADMANIGGRYGGAITAGCFLARYTKKLRWAHLDIAGTAWESGEKKGATGRPVPLLTQFLLQRCGKAG